MNEKNNNKNKHMVPCVNENSFLTYNSSRMIISNKIAHGTKMNFGPGKKNKKEAQSTYT